MQRGGINEHHIINLDCIHLSSIVMFGVWNIRALQNDNIPIVTLMPQAATCWGTEDFRFITVRLTTI